MFSNKLAFALVLIGLISVSNMASSAAVGAEPTVPTDTTAKSTENGDTTQKSTENVPTGSAPTGETDSTGSTNDDTTVPVTGTTNGSGYPSISYGMLFSVCGALFYLIF